MYTNTDIFVLVLLIIALYRGWRNGFIKSFFTPGAFIFSYIIGALYMDFTKNLVMAMILVMSLTLIISVTAHILLALARRTVGEKDRKFVFWGSRILGIAAGVVWQVFLITCVLILIDSVPEETFKTKLIHKDVRNSHSFQVVNHRVIPRLPILFSIQRTLEVFGDENQFAYWKDSDEFLRLENDVNIQDLINDPEASELIKEKNVQELMRHPKLKKLLTDEATMRKITEFSQLIYDQKAVETKNWQEKMKEMEEENEDSI